MRQLVKQTILGLLINSVALPAFAGFYAGIGGSGNTINENFNSTILSSDNKSGNDS